MAVEREAHFYGLPVVAWMYSRGKSIKNEFDRKVLAYAARIGLELGADIIKIKYNGNPKDLAWVVKSAGKTKVVVAGGTKEETRPVNRQVYQKGLASCPM